jgi:hypothetical protein
MKQKEKSTILVINILILNFLFSGLAVAEYRSHNAMNSSYVSDRNYYRAMYISNRYCPKFNSNKYSQYSRHTTFEDHYSNYRKPYHKTLKINFDGDGVRH